MKARHLLLLVPILSKDHLNFFFYLFSEENHEVFANVDFWYVPCNYSIVDAPVVLATFVEGLTCQLNTSINEEEEERVFDLCLTLTLPPSSTLCLLVRACASFGW